MSERCAECGGTGLVAKCPSCLDVDMGPVLRLALEGGRYGLEAEVESRNAVYAERDSLRQQLTEARESESHVRGVLKAMEGDLRARLTEAQARVEKLEEALRVMVMEGGEGDTFSIGYATMRMAKAALSGVDK